MNFMDLNYPLAMRWGGGVSVRGNRHDGCGEEEPSARRKAPRLLLERKMERRFLVRLEGIS